MKFAIGVLFLAAFAWAVVDHEGTSQVLNAGAGGFKTAAQGIFPPSTGT